MGKHHPRMTTANISEILERMYISDYFDCFNLADMRAMIDIHFTRDYGIDTDYNINHFMTPGILDRLCEEVVI